MKNNTAMSRWSFRSLVHRPCPVKLLPAKGVPRLAPYCPSSQLKHAWVGIRNCVHEPYCKRKKGFILAPLWIAAGLQLRKQMCACKGRKHNGGRRSWDERWHKGTVKADITSKQKVWAGRDRGRTCNILTFNPIGSGETGHILFLPVYHLRFLLSS